MLNYERKRIKMKTYKEIELRAQSSHTKHPEKRFPSDFLEEWQQLHKIHKDL